MISIGFSMKVVLSKEIITVTESKTALVHQTGQKSPFLEGRESKHCSCWRSRRVNPSPPIYLPVPRFPCLPTPCFSLTASGINVTLGSKFVLKPRSWENHTISLAQSGKFLAFSLCCEKHVWECELFKQAVSACSNQVTLSL